MEKFMQALRGIRIPHTCSQWKLAAVRPPRRSLLCHGSFQFHQAAFKAPSRMVSSNAIRDLPLSHFEVGQNIEGTVVQIYCPSGVSVDVGCEETLGFLEVEEFQDGFPLDGPFSFKPGEKVNVRVLDVNPNAKLEDHGEPDPRGDHGNTGKLHLTRRSGDLRRPPRYIADTQRCANLEPFTKISSDTWLDGEVVMLSSWAAFLKIEAPCGEPFVGILSKEDFRGDFAATAIRGSHFQVRIKQLDIQCRRLLLTMTGK
eukprot:TRINITY_DN96731_c0_g1_i1.p1 TRINITY_DN96731_c0_g1~~TRINITY_DN96731_c0_g1_i1.p1  ORF type:complete len:257 (+),score=31.39 TRINITY_DN96731_c0_g1_i1:28-798(+)